MSNNRVVAKRFVQTQVGKHLGDTKKRFVWTFTIGEQSYQLTFVSSILSGKKIITLNSQQIHSEKNILNIDFDFVRSINNHIIRIMKVPESVNSYTLRIDNQQFDNLTEGRSYQKKFDKQQKKKQQQFDPFSDFSQFAQTSSKVKSNNDFGDFDFDDFSPTKPKITNSPSKVQSKPQNVEIDIFNNDFTANQKQPNQFAAKFLTEQKDLLSQDAFSTNVYGANNNYMDLYNNNQQASEAWSGINPPSKQQKWTDNFKIDMTAKQAVNKVKMTFEQTKNKVIDYSQSLI